MRPPKQLYKVHGSGHPKLWPVTLNAEGWRHARGCRKALRDHGYTVVWIQKVRERKTP